MALDQPRPFVASSTPGSLGVLETLLESGGPDLAARFLTEMAPFRGNTLIAYWRRILVLYGLLLAFFLLGGIPLFVLGPLLVVPAATHQFASGARPSGWRYWLVLLSCIFLVFSFVEAVRHLPDPLSRFLEFLPMLYRIFVGAVAVLAVPVVVVVLLEEAKKAKEI